LSRTKWLGGEHDRINWDVLYFSRAGAQDLGAAPPKLLSWLPMNCETPLRLAKLDEQLPGASRQLPLGFLVQIHSPTVLRLIAQQGLGLLV
jgi:hypothetical protein